MVSSVISGVYQPIKCPGCINPSSVLGVSTLQFVFAYDGSSISYSLRLAKGTFAPFVVCKVYFSLTGKVFCKQLGRSYSHLTCHCGCSLLGLFIYRYPPFSFPSRAKAREGTCLGHRALKGERWEDVRPSCLQSFGQK